MQESDIFQVLENLQQPQRYFISSAFTGFRLRCFLIFYLFFFSFNNIAERYLVIHESQGRGNKPARSSMVTALFNSEEFFRANSLRGELEKGSHLKTRAEWKHCRDSFTAIVWPLGLQLFLFSGSFFSYSYNLLSKKKKIWKWLNSLHSTTGTGYKHNETRILVDLLPVLIYMSITCLYCA